MAVIGRCTVANCGRAATEHVTISVGLDVVAGVVCDHCATATERAAFLLDLRAA